MAETAYSNVQYTAQEYIRRMAIVPVGYNVPQNEMCKVERLPQKGITTPWASTAPWCA
jgi:hypothetical protein